jgi:hypothetical protein
MSTEPCCEVNGSAANRFPAEIWSQIISSISVEDEGTLLSVSLTNHLLREETKRVMLRNITVEYGEPSNHDHLDKGSPTLSGAGGAIYREKRLLDGFFLTEPKDKDLIRSICICWHPEIYPHRDRRTVKELIDLLLGYRHMKPRAESKSLEDVNVIFIGRTFNCTRNQYWKSC